MRFKWFFLALFFVSTLWLSFSAGRVFVSPDEHAAFTFASLFAQTGEMCVPEPMNAEVGNVLHPRSTAVAGACIVPGSFLGMPFLAGVIGRAFGEVGMLLFTPVLATAAVLALWNLVRRLSKDELLADISAALAMTHPGFWYYTSRAMMHNVGMTAFLVLGVWCAVVGAQTKRLWMVGLAGAAVGGAIFMRTFEVTWILVSVVALMVVFRRRLTWKFAASFGFGLALMIGVMGIANALVYGDPFTTGYNVKSSAVLAAAPVIEEVAPAPPVQTSPIASVMQYVLPFGFHEYAILQNVWRYGFQLFWWASALAGVGLVMALRRPGRLRQLAIATLVLAAWLGVVYGSWSFSDTPDPRAITIGNSHIRYWLPLFVLGSVFAAVALREFARRWENRTALITVMLVLAALSAKLVYFSYDGVVPSAQALTTFIEKREAVLAATEEDAVIVNDRADKYLFPDRRVVVPLRDEYTYQSLPFLVDKAPVYYFGITFPDVDLAHLNDEKLASLGLRIDLVLTVDNESLYRITRR